MLDVPNFVPAMSNEISGDDPLGMAPVNERLYRSVFPGINNTVRFIRVYSALCWQLGLVQDAIERRKLSVAQAKTLYRSAVEKIQLLLTWTNVLQGVPSLPGATRPYQSVTTSVTLSFKSFGSNKAAYLDAVQYRPSLTNGLKFVDTREHGILGNLEAGQALAAAFDEHARQYEDYAWLANLNELETTPKQIARLQAVFDLWTPSAKEQEAFLARYFPKKRPENPQSEESHRWAGLMLALRAIATLEVEKYYADVDNIRATMARGRCFDGTELELAGVEQEQQWWAVLQLRQLQRLTLDTLEVVLEQHLDLCLQRQSPRDMDSICDGICIQLDRLLDSEGVKTVNGYIALVKQEQGSSTSVYHIPATKSKADIFELLDNLHGNTGPAPEGHFPILVTIFKALVVCAVEADNMQANKYAREAAEAGAGEGSLADLARSAKEFADSTPGEWLSYFLRHWVINRHFYVATFRSDRARDGNNRFRFVSGDTGLQRFDSTLKYSEAGLARDHLEHALILLEQCGLIEIEEGDDGSGSGYVLTSAGKSRLAYA